MWQMKLPALPVGAHKLGGQRSKARSSKGNFTVADVLAHDAEEEPCASDEKWFLFPRIAPPVDARCFLTDSPRESSELASGDSPPVSPTSANARTQKYERVMQQMAVEHGVGEEQVLGVLRKISCFSELTHAQLRTLYKRGRHRYYPKYSTIVREAAAGRSFYVLVLGQVLVGSKGVGSGETLFAGQPFGEAVLVMQGERTQTVEALMDCYVLQYYPKDVADVPIKLDGIRAVLVKGLLEKLPFTKNVTKAQLEELSSMMDVKYVPKDEVVCKEGDPSEALYFVIEGTVAMFKSTEDGSLATQPSSVTRADSMSPWFGDVVASKPPKRRNTTAVCTDASKLLIVPPEKLFHFLELCPFFHGMYLLSANVLLNLRGESGGLGSGGTQSVIARQVALQQKDPLACMAPSLARATKNWERVSLGVLRLQIELARQAGFEKRRSSGKRLTDRRPHAQSPREIN